MTIAGRLLFNSMIEILGLGKQAVKAVKTTGIDAQKVWGIHLVSVALLMLLVTRYFNIPWWHYLLIAYFANSLTRIRSEWCLLKPRNQYYRHSHEDGNP
jgi:hypothetical protein